MQDEKGEDEKEEEVVGRSKGTAARRRVYWLCNAVLCVLGTSIAFVKETVFLY